MLNMPMKKLPRIVVIGGGTGSYTILTGLKRHRVHLTAIVSMADDGGSSGRLRDEFGHLPPGDVRRCLLALSSDSSPALRRLFEYRFDRGQGLGGHNFGNLLLTALTELTGRSDLAIAEAGRLLGVKGEVLPVTLSDSRLFAELEDGTILRGETHIDIRAEGLTGKIARIFLEPRATAYPKALAAIHKADAIVIGPGDLYTSVLPNLLVAGIPSAVISAPATRIYVCNVMTKHGETDGYRASDFVREVQRYLGASWSLDHVILNDTLGLPQNLLDRYAEEQAFPVAADVEQVRQLGPCPHVRPVASASNLLRHDPDQLANAILKLIEQAATGRADTTDEAGWRPPQEAAPADGRVLRPEHDRLLQVVQ
jgi:uncharacterized cofD-like protein